MTDPPTQTKKPARAMIRTVTAAIVGFLPVLPTIAKEFGLVESLPWMATVLAVSAAITRILATESAEKWLNRYIPWLTADAHPPEKEKANHD